MRFLTRITMLSALIGTVLVGGGYADLKLRLKESKRSRVFIISVGIDKYNSPGLNSLKFAVADAEALAQQLEARNTARGHGIAQGDRGSIAVTGSEPEVVRIVLRDKLATREGISQAFNEVARQITTNDIFFFSYSGMGAAVKGEFVLLTSDSSYSAGRTSVNEAITTAELQAMFRRIRARNKLLVLDSCDSADGYDALASAFIEPNPEIRAAVADNVLFIGTDGITTEPSELGHGTLTKVVLEGLEGAADFDSDGLISASELEAFVYCGSIKYKKFQISPRTVRSGEDFYVAFTDAKQKDLVKAAPAKPLDRGPLTVSSGAASADKRNGDDYALLFANDYANDPNWPELKNPLNDVQDIAAELRNRYGFKEVVVKENLTSREIREVLMSYQSKSFPKPDDQLFVFFAGHGTTDPVSDIASVSYFVGSKGPAFSVENSGHFMPLDSILTMIAGLKINHVMTVFDACYAGQVWKPAIATYARRAAIDLEFPSLLHYAALDRPRRGIGKSAEPALQLGAVDDRLIFAKRTMATQSRIILTSGNRPVADAYKLSDGSLSRNSPFANKLLEALREGGRNYNVLTAREIYTAVLGLPVQPMVGEMENTNGDFVFVGK